MEEPKPGESQPTTQAPATGESQQPGQPAPALDNATAVKLAELRRAIKNGGGWFYWIAGLSLINTVITLSHGSFRFIFGLGFTQLIDEIIAHFGGPALVIGLPINLFITALYVMFGYYASRRARWAFIAGMLFYILDALLILVVKDWFGLAFHVFALFGIVGGLGADARARKIEEAYQPGAGAQ